MAKTKREMAMEFLKSGGNNCPSCKGENIQGHEVNIASHKAFQEQCCVDCDAWWIASYTLSGCHNIELADDSLDVPENPYAARHYC